MPLKGEQRVITHHAGAVICQADEFSAASLDVDADSGRARVESIFEQLFDHRGWTVDNFSGRDLVRHLIGKDVNATHRDSTGSGLSVRSGRLWRAVPVLPSPWLRAWRVDALPL